MYSEKRQVDERSADETDTEAMATETVIDKTGTKATVVERIAVAIAVAQTGLTRAEFVRKIRKLLCSDTIDSTSILFHSFIFNNVPSRIPI
jgi:hypothetical protein